MTLLPHILFWITLGGTHLASAQMKVHAKRYSRAPFSPTGCTTTVPIVTPTGTCSLSNLGLPNYSSKTITYTSSTTVSTTYRTPEPTADWQIILNADIE